MCLKLNEKHLEIAKILVEKIKNEQTISYSELSEKVGIILGKNSELYHYIGDLSYYSFDNEMPLISAIVVRKEENMSGEGFYGVYEDKRDIKVNKNKHIEVFIEELNRVMKYDNWDKLIELL
ncbi:hypothetical protein CHF27_013495 [Romboutsia maritimum]|uniref:Uncharacterized protein n=1 Tax=Romboutsia maritimum TaxID=2020948 RepID=A0A371IPM3_9FIRM|nr:hypothetical protein [Romboutsia maritimum]RDY22428.1 hypothetical protein CHF27_013495 [Romboutsia maritimum]